MHNRETCTRKALHRLAVFFLLLVPLAIIPILAGWFVANEKRDRGYPLPMLNETDRGLPKLGEGQ